MAARSSSIGKQLEGATGKLTPTQIESFKAELAKLSGEGVAAAGPRLNELQQRIAAALLAAPQQPVTQAA